MSDTPITGWYALKHPTPDTARVYFHSKVEKNQIADLDGDILSIERWSVPSRMPEAKFSVPYISSLTGKTHYHYLDFIVQTRDKITHLIENKPSNLIEASYNVEPTISDLAAGRIAPESLDKHQPIAIAVRDKRLATEHFVKRLNNSSQKYVYHLTYNWRPKAQLPAPTTHHDLYLVIKEKLLAYNFTSQQDILHYVNSCPEFKEMSRQTLAYNLTKAIEKRYFSKADYDFYIDEGKKTATARAAANAEAAEQARIDAIAAAQRKQEREAHFAEWRVQRSIDIEAADQAEAERQRTLDQEHAIRKAQWAADHPQETAAEKVRQEKEHQQIMEMLSASLSGNPRRITSPIEEID